MPDSSVTRRGLERSRRQVRQVNRSPVKHYVRLNGWLPSARTRYERVNRPLRLFTLCGEDAIDVRLFAAERLIEKDSRGFPGVSWCELSPETASILRTKLGRVSRSFLGTLEKLSQTAEFKEWFPFDVINLDFTSLPFPRSQPPFNSTWVAVTTILACQQTHRAGCELFLTFNADRSPANDDAVNQLVSLVETNFESRNWSRDLFMSTSGGVLPADLSSSQYDKFLLIALPKFVGRLAADQGFGVRELGRFAYTRHPPGRRPYRITKFTFSLEPLEDPPPRLDALGRHELTAAAYDFLVRRAFEEVGVDVDSALDANMSQTLDREVNLLLQKI